MAISRMQQPRQLYGLGSLVKSIGKTVKKVIKSPIGKAAILGIGAFGLPGGAFGMKGFLPQAFKTGASQFLFGGGTKFLPGATAAMKGAAVSNPGIFGMAKNFLGTTGGKFAVGGALTSILAASGMGAEEIEATKRDPDKLKIYLRDYYSKTNPDAKPEEIDAFVETNVSEYAVGGRVGLKGGSKKTALGDYEEEDLSYLKDLSPEVQKAFLKRLYIDSMTKQAEGGRIGLMGGAMPTGIMKTNKLGIKERDYRETGGFVPVGIKEKADDVPAMLSKNEFVMTADAVRGMGGGNIEKGAQRLYDQMKTAEKRVV